jgi:hypothetical protein
MTSLGITNIVLLTVIGRIPDVVQLPASKTDGNVTVLVEQ